MEPEGSSPYSQVPAICPYPEPTPSSLHSLPLPEDPWSIYYLIKVINIYDYWNLTTRYIVLRKRYSRAGLWQPTCQVNTTGSV